MTKKGKIRQVHVSMPEEVYEMLLKESVESGESMAKLMREGLELFFTVKDDGWDPIIQNNRVTVIKHPITDLLNEYELEVKDARRRGGVNARKAAVSNNKLKRRIQKVLEEAKEPLGLSRIAKEVDYNRKKVREILELYEDDLWIIFKPKQKGQAWKIALKSGENEKLYKAEKEVMKLKESRKKKLKRKRKAAIRRRRRRQKERDQREMEKAARELEAERREL